jgi:hypothetical protein
MVMNKTEDNITWIDMPKPEFFWESTAVQGIKIGTEETYRG